jgi:hypothetical protein
MKTFGMDRQYDFYIFHVAVTPDNHWDDEFVMDFWDIWPHVAASGTGWESVGWEDTWEAV